MIKQERFIPNHSLEALEEAYQAALLNLAFQQIEQEEMAMIHRRIHDMALEPQNARFERRLGRRLRRERARAMLRSSLPRAAQIAACLIAVLSITVSVALATSQQVRSWAAGVLSGSVLDTSGFSFGEPLTARITGGVNYDGHLLLVEENETLVLREDTAAEPVRYEWKDRGTRSLAQLAVYNGRLYALYKTGYVDQAAQERSGAAGKYEGSPLLGDSFDGLGLGRVQLKGNGTFTVDELASFDGDKLFADGVYDCCVQSAAAGNGKLYFITGYSLPETDGFSFSNGRVRFFACDLTGFELTELTLPIENSESPDCELFSDGEVFLATSTQELPVQIWHIGADGGSKCLAMFGEGSRPNSFAYCADTNTLYFQRDAAIYAATHFNVEGAVRVALSGGSEGDGLLIGENSYAIVGNDVEVFNFDDQLGAVTELTVGGGINASVDAELRAANPSLTLIEDPCDKYGADYVQALISGEATADIVEVLSADEGALHSASWGRPIMDGTIRAEIDRMPEGVRRYVSKADTYIAFPCSTFSTCSDVSISPACWAQSGLGRTPETWLDLVRALGKLSHSATADKYAICTDLASIEQSLTAQLTEGFARSWAAQGKGMDFGGTDFRKAMETLAQIDFSALRYVGNDDAENILIYWQSGDSLYDPSHAPDDRRGVTLKIRSEDVKVSKGSCYLERINPNADADAKLAAYSYMRSKLASDEYAYERLRWDFATPAMELAAWSKGAATPKQLEAYREAVGDVWLGELSEQAKKRRDDALAAYARGSIGFDALADQLNEIYAEY